MDHLDKKKVTLLAIVFIILPAVVWLVVYNVVADLIFAYKNYQPPCFSYHPAVYPPEIPKFEWKGTGLVTLWFDDAWQSVYTNAAPIMEDYHYPGALAVAIKFVCKPNFMTWNTVYELQSKGWEISSHSLNHICDIRYYTNAAIEKELLISREILRKHGLRVNQFVMPCGYSLFNLKQFFLKQNPDFVEGAKKYYTAFRTTQGDFLNPLPVEEPYNLSAFEIRNDTPLKTVLNKLQQAAARHQWLILVFHQVGEKDETRVFNVSIKRFKQILDLISNSKLPIVLPTQAVEAGQENKLYSPEHYSVYGISSLQFS